MSEEVEYIEPTQEHAGQVVEVRDNESQLWFWGKLTGILSDNYRFAVKREKDQYSHAWRFARIARPLTYAERQAKCGLKVGDMVRIVRAYEKHEQGYWCGFFDSMKRDIGLVGTIQKFDSLSQPCVYVAESSYVWPYFVLEKIEDRVARTGDVGKIVYVDGAPQDEFTLDGHYISLSGHLYGVIVIGDKRFVYELSNLRVKE